MNKIQLINKLSRASIANNSPSQAGKKKEIGEPLTHYIRGQLSAQEFVRFKTEALGFKASGSIVFKISHKADSMILRKQLLSLVSVVFCSFQRGFTSYRLDMKFIFEYLIPGSVDEDDNSGRKEKVGSKIAEFSFSWEPKFTTPGGIFITREEYEATYSQANGDLTLDICDVYDLYPFHTNHLVGMMTNIIWAFKDAKTLYISDKTGHIFLRWMAEGRLPKVETIKAKGNPCHMFVCDMHGNPWLIPTNYPSVQNAFSPLPIRKTNVRTEPSMTCPSVLNVFVTNVPNDYILKVFPNATHFFVGMLRADTGDKRSYLYSRKDIETVMNA